LHRISCGQNRDRPRWGQENPRPATCAAYCVIAFRRPAPKCARGSQQRCFRLFGSKKKGAVGQGRRICDHRTPGRPACPLGMQRPVHIAGRRKVGRERFRPSRAEGQRVGPSAFEARPMAGGESGRLVQEEQFGIAARRHRLALPPLEGQAADDPRLCRPAPPGQLPALVVKAAAVARPGAASRVGDDFAERRYAVLQRHGGSGRLGSIGGLTAGRSCRRYGRRRADRRPSSLRSAPWRAAGRS